MRTNIIILLTLAILTVKFSACSEKEEALPVLNVPDSLFVQEGTGTQQIAVISLQLSSPAVKDVSVNWSTLNGTAQAGEDYVAVSDGLLVIPKGASVGNLEVALINDGLYEPNEVFSVTVTGLENAMPGAMTCKVAVQNDDAFIPEVRLDSRFSKQEGPAGQSIFQVPVRLSGATQGEVSFKWSTMAGWAKSNEDFIPVESQTVIFEPGETDKKLEVTVIGDDVFEMDDYFDIQLTDIQGATCPNATLRVYIENDDSYSPELQSDGYITPDAWPGMQLVWADEFNDVLINSNNWTHELGGGGWGNQEWEVYTNSATNSYLSGGKLNIIATKQGETYNSARMVTKGKREFKYGRIDIRAKMPYGQGIWPALWTLGSNVGQVGWPKCGEIDIMEYLGQNQSTVYGTLHWNDGGHQSNSNSYTLPGNASFHDSFHVFSLVWEENVIKIYVDYHLMNQIKDTQALFDAFRLPHFFIFNLAVGGVWPGYPDETTVFPQTLSVDYIRVFQVPQN
jgi:beta-glucanase (GH16 family)